MKKLWIEFKQRPWWRKTLNIVELLFAGAGFGIIGAWAVFQLGLTNNGGAVDENYRSLMSVSEIEDLKHAHMTQEEIDDAWAIRYGELAALARYYPVNARLILTAAQQSDNPLVVDRMIAAARTYMDENEDVDNLAAEITKMLNQVPQQQRGNVIPWMDGPEWPALKEAILRDSALIIGSAAGVAVMGMEKIDFIWYLKKISWLALVGYIAGAIVFIAMNLALEPYSWWSEMV